VAELLTAPASPVTQALVRDATATLWRPASTDPRDEGGETL
jgi:peptide/nickel transport system ATP-binding protein